MKHSHIEVRLLDLPEVQDLLARLTAVAAAAAACEPARDHGYWCSRWDNADREGCDCGVNALRAALDHYRDQGAQR